MKKKLLALILALTTAFSTVALSGCEFSLNLGSDTLSGDSDTGTHGGDTVSPDDGADSTGGTDDDGCAEHVDGDDNGVCDTCANSVIRNVDIFAINDLHGKVLDGDGHIGVDELTTYYKQAKAANPDTFFLSSGDMWQGANLSNLTKGKFVTDWMNEVGFASMTLGNHEYDWGEEYISANADAANFPFLGINVYSSVTNARVDYCQPSVMYETGGGAKIGIIGAMGDCYSSISSDKVEQIYFKTGSSLTALVKSESEKLRAQGADLIVYSMHDDFSEYDEMLSDGYVDIVFEGHSHSAYAKTDGKGIWHLQGGGDNDGISRAQITVNIANEKHSVTSAKTVNSSVYASCAKDPIVETLEQKYSEQLEEANRVVGYTDKYRGSNEICDTVAQLYYELGEKTWGDKYDIVLGGAFLSTRDPYDLFAGDITYGDIIAVHPYGNTLCMVEATGQEILDALEVAARFTTAEYKGDGYSMGEDGGFLSVSGMRYTIDTSIEHTVVTDENDTFVEVTGARRVKNAEVLNAETGDYEPLDPEKTYTFACHNYIIKEGGNGQIMFQDNELLIDEALLDYEVLVNYLSDTLGGEIPAQYSAPEGRITLE